jgi:hypothetical protein
MKRLSVLALVFAVLFLALYILPVFFRVPFPPYPLMSVQDAIDLLTPLVLIPICWLLFRSAGGGPARLVEELAFVVLAVLWVLGHGIHLSANSINNLAEGLAKSQTLDITGTSIYQLIYFFDEKLSHPLWHGGIVGVALVLILREWRSPAGERTLWWAAVVGGLIHGFTLFCMFLEGQSVPLGLAFTLGVTLLALIWGRKRLARQPLLAFFFVACLVALLFFAGWGLRWGGFPEFTEVGLI